MPTWTDQLTKINELRQSRKELDEGANTPTIESKRRLDAVRLNLNEAITGIYVDPHPRSVVKNLSDKIPFLLMPVRMETRFVTGPPPELWLRVYPDDIAIQSHEKLLTKNEIEAGERYWQALFTAEKEGDAQKEERKKQAWNGIVSALGSKRAAWVALKTKPGNWNEIATLTAVNQLIFPIHDIIKPSAWSRAPRTYELPDKFVVMLYEGERIVKEVIGNIIPDELFLGPDPLDAENAFITGPEMLEFGESYDWTSNFEKAIAVGMGFKIPLTAEQAVRGFDKILVLGLTLSADATQTQKSLEALIDNHHYSDKGFSIVKQGTATNNTDQGNSGYTENDPFNTGSYFTETGEPLFKETDDCDGKNLAYALGIDYGPLQYIQYSDAQDLKEAVAMNTALYPATLGYYFDTMLAPVLTEDTKLRLRDFFVQHVTGRGALPAIRVGDQPYGVLLTSDFSNWKWSRAEVGADAAFLTGMQKLLNHYSVIWNGMLHDQVMYTGRPGTDPSEVMMNLIGLQPASVSFDQRVAYTTDDLKNRAALNDADDIANSIQTSYVSKNNVLAFFSGLGYDIVDANGNPRVPQLLRLVYQHFTTKLDAGNLIDGRPLSEKDPIHETGGLNYIQWLLKADTIEKLRKKDFGEGIVAPNSLLFLNLLRAFLLELNHSSNNWFQTNGIAFDAPNAAVNFHNIRKPDITKWEVMKGKVGIAKPDHAENAKSVADYLLTTGNSEGASAFLKEMKTALKELAQLPTARLERCFVEHIDTCTYRLDAWQAGFFHRRLLHQRSTAIGGRDQPRRAMGVYSGAFGWLEDIRPSSKRKITPPQEVPGEPPLAAFDPLYEYADNGGFVHTPSLNHAMAAAVLRSGYINHANISEPDLMAVNLSSRRIRNAKSILEGIANGQSLEALLGYQFERGLHDRGSESDPLKPLNAFIYDFRVAFPINKHIVLQQGDPSAATESIPAHDVVNGLTLAERTDDFPYGATGPVTGATDAMKNAVRAEKNKLADTLDAVKDLLMSESVYQLVQGNFDRGAAVMNAVKNSAVPPEMDIIDTPRSSKFTFTNRVTIQFENSVFTGTSPRAGMEAGMNQWLQGILGDMGQLAFKVSLADRTQPRDLTIAQLGLEPIDLVYIAGNELNTGSGNAGQDNSTAASELETRIADLYRNLNGLEDDAPVSIEFLQLTDATGKRPLGELLPMLQMIKSFITDSRALHAQDFMPSSEEIVTDTTNLKGYDVLELKGRIDNAKLVFDHYSDGLRNITIVLSEPTEGISGSTTLGVLWDALEAVNKDLSGIVFVMQDTEVTNLSDLLVLISGFGLADSFPQVTLAGDDAKKRLLISQAQQVSKRMKTISAQFAPIRTQADSADLTERKVELLIQAGKLVLGDVFNIIPKFNYANGVDIQNASDDRDQLLSYARNQLKMNFVADEWLQQIAHVRPRLARWDGIRTFSEILTGDTLELLPLQLPYRANDSWVSVEFPAELAPGVPFNIDHDTISITVHGSAAFSVSASQSGLMIDEIVEMIPGKDEVTGITFNYNQPNAVAPQTLLLAVTPEETGSWNWDALVGILNDTLLRAKQRAVEPDLLYKSKDSDISVLLPAILANFSEYDLDLALDYRSNVAFYNEHAPVISVAL